MPQETKIANVNFRDQATKSSKTGLRVSITGGKFGAGMIQGISIIEEGPALGHGMDIDTKSVSAVTSLGNATSKGVKSRFTHPDMCNDGLGNAVGRAFDFRDEKGSDGKLRSFADLHFFKSADVAKVRHIAGLAEESPESLGVSIVASGRLVVRVNAEGEPEVDDNEQQLPPVFRVDELHAADVVDEPAANTRGLFGDDDPALEAAEAISDSFAANAFESPGRTSAELNDQFLSLLIQSEPVVELMDRFAAGGLRTHFKLSTEDGLARVAGFLNREFKRRGVNHQPVTAASLSRAFAQAGLFKDGQPMFRFSRLFDPGSAGSGGGGTTVTNPAAPGAPPVQLAAAGGAGGSTPPAPSPAPATVPGTDPDSLRREGAEGEARRRDQIEGLAKLFPAYNLKAAIDNAIEKKFSFDQARVACFEAMFAQAPQVQTGGTVQVLADERDKFIDAAGDALLLRCGKLAIDDKIAKRKARAEAAASSGLANLGPQRLAMKCLKRAGVQNPDELDADVLFQRAMFGGSYGHSSSDFPLILANSGNKALLSAFEIAPVTWDIWCKIGNLANFLTAKRLRRSESALFKERPEGTPAEETTFNERGESIVLRNWANSFSYTRQMFINDDLGAFLDVGAEFGAAANATIEYQVYLLLTSNAGVGPTMEADGLALFHATHKNKDPLSAGVPSQDRIEAMVDAMMTQNGLGTDGSVRPLGAPPSLYLAPPIVASAISAIIDAPFRGTAGFENPQDADVRAARALKVPILKAFSATRWYGVADKNRVPSMEVAFLNGTKTVRTQTIIGTSVAGVKIVADMDFGLFPTGGWEGIATNAGV